ncbi:hypothetical protein Ancab_011894 [Ancistrocladus abbreviatus]
MFFSFFGGVLGGWGSVTRHPGCTRELLLSLGVAAFPLQHQNIVDPAISAFLLGVIQDQSCSSSVSLSVSAMAIPLPSSSLLLSALILFSVLLVTRGSHNIPPQMPTGKQLVPLFVFGDSLFDPGNNNYLNSSTGMGMGQATTWPYGETFFKHPTGRLSDGRIVPDFIGHNETTLRCPSLYYGIWSYIILINFQVTQCCGCAAEFFRLPLWKPYLEPGQHRFGGGANFASGGAGVLTETHRGTISLRGQLSYFKDVVKTLKRQFGEVETKNLMGRAVYLISMGGNDYFSFYSSYPNATRSSQKQFVGIVTRNLTQILEEIYNIGGRKIAFQNVGALGCVPINRAKTVDGSCLEELSAMARMHNLALSRSLENLGRRLPGFKYSIFDYYHAILDRVNRPKKYGFTNGTSACCGGKTGMCGGKMGSTEVCSGPSKYVWFDGGHTTEACNWQLAKLIWKGKTDVVRPYNVKQLYELM